MRRCSTWLLSACSRRRRLPIHSPPTTARSKKRLAPYCWGRHSETVAGATTLAARTIPQQPAATATRRRAAKSNRATSSSGNVSHPHNAVAAVVSRGATNQGSRGVTKAAPHRTGAMARTVR